MQTHGRYIQASVTDIMYVTLTKHSYVFDIVYR